MSASIPALLLIGALGGLTAGSLGAGAGVVTVILLTSIGMDPPLAVGTALMFALPIAAWGSILHHRQETSDPRVAIALGEPAALAAVFAARLTLFVPKEAFRVAFAIIALVAAYLLVTEGRVAVARRVEGRSRSDPPKRSQSSYVKIGSGGLLVGTLQGLLGVGGGFLFVPLMIRWLKMQEHVAVGSSLIAVFMGSLTGGATHLLIGNFNLPMLATLIPAGAIGAWAGAKASPLLPATILRRTLAAILVSLAVTVIVI